MKKIVLAAGCLVLLAGCGSSATGAASTDTGALSSPTGVASSASSASSAPKVNKTAAKIVAQEGPLCGLVTQGMGQLFTEIKTSSTSGDLVTVASDTMTLKKAVGSIRSDLLGDGSSDNVVNAWTAAGDLGSALGTLENLTGSPDNAQIAAKFNSQYDQAVEEWNQAYTAIWASVGAAKPPLLPVRGA